MSGVNRVYIVGHLGQDPELKAVGDNQVVNFSIATSEQWTDKKTGEKQERTEWHSIIQWGKGAGMVGRYKKKGDLVCVEGKLQTRSWETDSGEKRYKTEINADRVTFLGGNKDKTYTDEGREKQVPITPNKDSSTHGLPNSAPSFDSTEEIPF